MAVKIRAKQVDDVKNRDMITLSDMRGLQFAIVHADLFWQKSEKSDIIILLERGEEVTLELSIAEETDVT